MAMLGNEVSKYIYNDMLGNEVSEYMLYNDMLGNKVSEYILYNGRAEQWGQWVHAVQRHVGQWG